MAAKEMTENVAAGGSAALWRSLRRQHRENIAKCASAGETLEKIRRRASKATRCGASNNGSENINGERRRRMGGVKKSDRRGTRRASVNNIGDAKAARRAGGMARQRRVIAAIRHRGGSIISGVSGITCEK
jgi:hypothetical protein